MVPNPSLVFLFFIALSEWLLVSISLKESESYFTNSWRHISAIPSAVDSSRKLAVSNTTQLNNILIIMHLNELKRSRDPLNDFASTLVCLAAILIILVNGMLCVFLIRDSRLWALVRSDFVLRYVNWNFCQFCKRFELDHLINTKKNFSPKLFYSVKSLNRIMFSPGLADLLDLTVFQVHFQTLFFVSAWTVWCFPSPWLIS